MSLRPPRPPGQCGVVARPASADPGSGEAAEQVAARTPSLAQQLQLSTGSPALSASWPAWHKLRASCLVYYYMRQTGTTWHKLFKVLEAGINYFEFMPLSH